MLQENRKKFLIKLTIFDYFIRLKYKICRFSERTDAKGSEKKDLRF